MNVLAMRNGNGLQTLNWADDPKMVALVKRAAARDCNTDEFDEFVAVARELRLNPLRKQIYAFVFSKDDDKKRNMVIVVGIDGMRAISARGGLYRPDNRPPRWTIDPHMVNPDTNPLGLVSCEVSIFTGHKLKDAEGGERIEWNEVIGVAFWDEFAPIVKAAGDDDYEWIDTGETWPDSGKPKKRKQLRQGAAIKLQLDPRKDGWRKSARHMLAKCAEAIAHRKANPEPLSRVYSDEEVDRARTIEVEYSDLTPSEMAAKGESDKRMELIGGPAILISVGEDGVLERVPHGQFADRVLAETKDMEPDAVASFMVRNRVALQEFWTHSKNDALELKKELEKRSAAAAKSGQSSTVEKAPGLGRSQYSKSVEANRDSLEAALLGEIDAFESKLGALHWANRSQERMATLSNAARARVDAAFQRKQDKLPA